VYQKFQIPIRVSGIFAISGGRDSNIQMQQSGGLLLMPGSTGMTPSFPSIPGRKCKRVPSGVPPKKALGESLDLQTHPVRMWMQIKHIDALIRR
jgi:hypothetical protein